MCADDLADQPPENEDRQGGRHENDRIGLGGNEKAPAQTGADRSDCWDPFGPVLSAENFPDGPINQHSRPGIQTALEKTGNKGAIAEYAIKEREQKGIKRKPIERGAICPLTMENLFGPIIVKMHGAATGEKKGRRSQARQWQR